MRSITRILHLTSTKMLQATHAEAPTSPSYPNGWTREMVPGGYPNQSSSPERLLGFLIGILLLFGVIGPGFLNQVPTLQEKRTSRADNLQA